MHSKFPEYNSLNLPEVNREIQEKWKAENSFKKSVERRANAAPFIFHEGPPSANGKPGIHHVMARTIKDIVCRYKTMQGFLVKRKAGWDTHGLPVELSVENTLGISKEDIGKSISVEKFNKTCRSEVMKYTDMWENLTRQMGYWINMDDPYVTYDNRYIETLWFLLKTLYDQDLIYKGYTIQPYSPAAGTGLSTHELNQPGCYRDVKDTTVTGMFHVPDKKENKLILDKCDTKVYFLAWTTTPWTLPSNTALAVGPNLDYALIKTVNPYLGNPVHVILAKDLVNAYFAENFKNADFDDFKPGSKKIPWQLVDEYKGSSLVGMFYEQLIPWVKPMGEAFRIIEADYVTTDEGTGLVHIAPTFGADDDRVAKIAGIAPMILIDKDNQRVPMVDKKGRMIPIEDLDDNFVKKYVDTSIYSEFAGRFVKNEYDENAKPDDPGLDVDIAVSLKKQGKAFKVEKYVHNYPHCWRTDKPVLYYPLDSWFIKTTAVKERMMELNNTINWKPKSTGEGRFGKWLENLVDWNLSRSRYWGTPLPIWSTEDGNERTCIGSVEQLLSEIEKAVQAGLMDKNPFGGFKRGDVSAENYEQIDLHRPFVDDIVLVSDSGKPMKRESDLIDVWFDSGAMPYAQWHYPFENKEDFNKHVPADFIAEGVDQTRGWFFTLHAIATMISDDVAFKNIISNGLVLDKYGNKMSKRLGNAVDPFENMNKYGADALRWYMVTNAQPWDNLKFDPKGIEEVQRKFFSTLYNTYSFFALYANIDGFDILQEKIPVDQRPMLDQWIISQTNSLIADVTESFDNYEPTRAGRLIQNFVIDHLSNWYVRLGRKRYWGGGMNHNKLAAYQTLHECLMVVTKLMSPIAPFYPEKLYADLTLQNTDASIHLEDFPACNKSFIQKDLEERMQMAQSISSMILALRRKVNIKVRQPLKVVMIPVSDKKMQQQLQKVEDIIKTETNIKTIEYLSDASDVLVKKIKPNFKSLGPKYGKLMKQITSKIVQMSQEDIANLENKNEYSIDIDGQTITLCLEDVEIFSEDIPGWEVSNQGNLTVALDIKLTDDLKKEGVARELINRIQNLRKDSGFDVIDKIHVVVATDPDIREAITAFESYICEQTLALSIKYVEKLEQKSAMHVNINNKDTTLHIVKADNNLKQ
ncbi:MAG: isoleucine--tRNA ligase [Bacteroidota bacterium]|nr:isoleucine--tRNA ligase [Bacteroidota bacterium]